MISVKKKIVIFFLLSAFTLNAQHKPFILKESILSPSKYTLSYWTTDNGLPQNNANDLIQTQDGHLWLSSFNGLIRFDGVSFTVFNTSNTINLETNRYTKLYEDNKGRLWALAEADYLVKYENGEFESYNLKETRIESLQSITSSPTGGIILATKNNGLMSFEDGKFTQLLKDTELENATILNVFFTTQEEILFSTYNGIYSLKNMKLNLLESHEHANHAYPFVQKNDSTVYTGYLGKLFEYKSGVIKRVHADLKIPVDYNLTFNADPDKNIWLASKKGLIKIEDEKLNYITPHLDITKKGIQKILVDKEGIIWVGTQNSGVFKLQKKRFNVNSNYNKLVDEIIYPIFEASNGDIWLGTSKSGVCKWTNNNITYYSPQNRKGVWAIAEDKDGSMWFGSHSSGVSRFKNNRFSIYHIQDGLPAESVTSLYKDSKERLWAGTGNGIAYFDGSKFIKQELDVEINQKINQIFEDSKNNFWICTSSGLIKTNDLKTTTLYSKKDGLLNNHIRYIYEDKEGALWVGTYGGGLHRLKDNTFFAFNKEKIRTSDIVSSIVEDDEGYLWMASNAGMYIANKTELNNFADGISKKLNYITLGHEEGLYSTEFNGGCQPSVAKLKNGDMWFPTTNGVAVINPKNLNYSYTIPDVVFSEIIADDTPLEKAKNIIVANNTSRLQVNFTAPYFTNENDIYFEYKMEGLDGEWIETTDRKITYTYIPSGNYVFRVRAYNKLNSNEYKEAELYLTVPKTLLQKTWFRILIGLGLLLLTVGLYRYRLDRIKIANRKLEKLAEQRTDALKKSYKELEQKNRELSQSEDLLIETNFTKAKVISIITHNIKGPLRFMNHVSDIMNTKWEEMPNSELKSCAETINDSGNKIYHLVDNILGWSKLQTQNFTLSTERFELKEMINKELEVLRLSAKQKNIKITNLIKPTIIANADKDALSLIIQNLISNAIKFTYNGGAIKINAKPGVKFTEVYIEDTGVGIPLEDIDKLFRTDVHHSTTGTNEEAGTGLGLLIAKDLINKHEGKIWVESQKGKGSTFIFTIPIVES